MLEEFDKDKNSKIESNMILNVPYFTRYGKLG